MARWMDILENASTASTAASQDALIPLKELPPKFLEDGEAGGLGS